MCVPPPRLQAEVGPHVLVNFLFVIAGEVRHLFGSRGFLPP